MSIIWCHYEAANLPIALPEIVMRRFCRGQGGLVDDVDTKTEGIIPRVAFGSGFNGLFRKGAVLLSEIIKGTAFEKPNVGPTGR